MRLLVQRVAEASVEVDGVIVGSIKSGLCVFIGVEDKDTETDLDWLCHKLVNMRIFSDADGKMNASLQDINGNVLLVSQFTLYASTKKGNRPSFIRSAQPDFAKEMYNMAISKLEKLLGRKVETGIFGAHMNVSLINDGPVTIWIDSANKE